MSDNDLRDMVLTYMGFVDGGEVTADGSFDNDLAHDRTDVAMRLLEVVRGHGYPEALLELVAGGQTRPSKPARPATAEYDLDRAAHAGGFGDDDNIPAGREVARRLYKVAAGAPDATADQPTTADRIVQDTIAASSDLFIDLEYGETLADYPVYLASMANAVTDMYRDLRTQVAEARTPPAGFKSELHQAIYAAGGPAGSYDHLTTVLTVDQVAAFIAERDRA